MHETLPCISFSGDLLSMVAKCGARLEYLRGKSKSLCMHVESSNFLPLYTVMQRAQIISAPVSSDSNALFATNLFVCLESEGYFLATKRRCIGAELFKNSLVLHRRIAPGELCRNYHSGPPHLGHFGFFLEYFCSTLQGL